MRLGELQKEEKIYIGWELFAALDAWDRAFKTSNIPLVFYDTLFQYGIEKFYVPRALEEIQSRFDMPNYLRKRIRYISHKTIRRSFDDVFNLFKENTQHTFPKRLELARKIYSFNFIQVIEEILGEKETTISPDFCPEKNLLRTTWFLNQLLVSSRLNTSAICFFSDEYKNEMLLEINSMLNEKLAIPLSHLIQTFKTTNKDSAKLAFSFSGNVPKHLEEIIHSENFHQYSRAHSEMRDGNIRIESVMRKITKTRDKLVSSFKELLRKNTLAFYLLEQSSAIGINSIVGGLPSSVATVFFGVLQRIIPHDRRVIVFSLENLMDENMLQLFRKDLLDKTGIDLALHIKDYFSL